MDGQSPSEKLSGHVVICNVNEKVREIVSELWWMSGHVVFDVVLIVQDEAMWTAHPEWHPPSDGSGRLVTVTGCPADREVLRAACIADANAVVVLADPNQGELADARSALVGIAIEHEHPGVHTVMELNLAVNRDHLRSTLVDDVVCLGEVAERLIAQSTVTPGVSRLFAHLLTTQVGTSQLFTPTLPEQLEGRTYREVARCAIRARAHFTVCGFIRDAAEVATGGPSKRQVVVNPRPGRDPGKDTKLKDGDQIILMAPTPPDLTCLVEAGSPP